MSTVAQCVVRDGRVRFCECLWEAILPTVRGLLHVTLFYTTQSTAGPGIVSVHECHHQKHLTCNPRMQMRRGGVGWGGVGVMVRLANAFKRKEEKDESLLRAQLHG